MTVKDLILAHTAEEAYNVYHNMFFNDEGVEAAAAEKARQEFCDFYNSLKMIKPILGDYVIMVFLHYDWDGIQAYLIATMYKKADFSNELLNNSLIKGISVFDINFMPFEEMQRLSDNTGLPISYAFEYFPWAEILGADVSVSNIRNVGSLKVLSAILYEMARFGYDEQSGEKEKEYEALFEMLDDETPPEPDIEDDSDEELDVFHQNLVREGLRTSVEEYKALKAYCDELEANALSA